MLFSNLYAGFDLTCQTTLYCGVPPAPPALGRSCMTGRSQAVGNSQLFLVSKICCITVRAVFCARGSVQRDTTQVCVLVDFLEVLICHIWNQQIIVMCILYGGVVRVSDIFPKSDS